MVVDVFHVPNLSANLLSVSQLTHTGKIVEYWPNQLFVKDVKNDRLIIVEGFLNSKGGLYKFCDLPRLDHGPTAFIVQTDK